MMRIALLSDIHANVIALEAVLRALKKWGVDEIVCLGDVATLGPTPVEALQMVRDLGCPCIMGNHDEFLLDPVLVETYSKVPIVVEAVDWCREQLSQEDLDFVSSFKRTQELELSDGTTMLLFHGSPRSHMDNLLSTTEPEVVDQWLEGYEPRVVGCGHTHVQMLRQHRGLLLVNPGSVGLPFREFVGGDTPTILPQVEFAIVEFGRGGFSVEMRSLPLNIEARKRAIEAIDCGVRDALLQSYL